MKLAPHEIASPLWQKLQAHQEARLVKHRARLETRLDEAETTRLRGQIHELKEFLDLAMPDRVIDADAG